MRVIDISLPLRSDLPPWPGDVAFSRTTALKRDSGGDANVSRIALSVHYATHADAPFHFNDAGAKIDEIDPARYCGPAQVVRLAPCNIITPEALRGVDLTLAPRLLLDTSCRRDLSQFPTTYPPLHLDLVRMLAAAGVKLLGLDAPSVDALDSMGMPVHHALGAADILIVENLSLSGVAPGIYDLFAVPLKIVGSDGAPLRAILVAPDR